MTWKHLIDVAKAEGVEPEAILRQAMLGERLVGVLVHTVPEYIEWEADPLFADGVVVDRIRAAGEKGERGYPVVSLSIRELAQFMRGLAVHGEFEWAPSADERDPELVRLRSVLELEGASSFTVDDYDDLLVKVGDGEKSTVGDALNQNGRAVSEATWAALVLGLQHLVQEGHPGWQNNKLGEIIEAWLTEQGVTSSASTLRQALGRAKQLYVFVGRVTNCMTARCSTRFWTRKTATAPSGPTQPTGPRRARSSFSSRAKSRIHRKGSSRRKLKKKEQAANHRRSRIGCRVEHVFGDQHTRQGGILVRTKGKVRAAVKIGMMNLT